MIDVKKYYEAQKKACEKQGFPVFAPYDGHCYRCGHQIFGEDKGYTLEEAGNFVITGCPYCHYSYCEQEADK